MDNILMYRKTEKEHLQVIEKAFKCLLNLNSKLNLANANFLRNKFIIQAT